MGTDSEHGTSAGERTPVLELADGTRLVPFGEGSPARLEGDADHAFTLADVQREDAQPFAGYRQERTAS